MGIFCTYDLVKKAWIDTETGEVVLDEQVNHLAEYGFESWGKIKAG